MKLFEDYISRVHKNKIEELKKVLASNCSEGFDLEIFTISHDCLRLLTEAGIEVKQGDICIYSKSKNSIKIFRFSMEL